MIMRFCKGQPNSRATLPDRKSTRLNSSHLVISYAVFCLKKKHIYAAAESRQLTPAESFHSGHLDPTASILPRAYIQTLLQHLLLMITYLYHVPLHLHSCE